MEFGGARLLDELLRGGPSAAPSRSRPKSAPLPIEAVTRIAKLESARRSKFGRSTERTRHSVHLDVLHPWAKPVTYYSTA
jgi:hypothetical protein